jgi:hypothetical protein
MSSEILDSLKMKQSEKLIHKLAKRIKSKKHNCKTKVFKKFLNNLNLLQTKGLSEDQFICFHAIITMLISEEKEIKAFKNANSILINKCMDYKDKFDVLADIKAKAVSIGFNKIDLHPT